MSITKQHLPRTAAGQPVKGPYQSAKHRLIDLSPHKPSNARRWLDWQCRMIPNALSGAVFIVRGEKPEMAKALAVWPSADTGSDLFCEISRLAMVKRRVTVQTNIRLNAECNDVCDCIAYPLVHNDKLLGTVVLAVTQRSDEQRKAVIQLLQWGIVWLQDLLNQGSAKPIANLAMELEVVKLVAQDVPLGVSGNQLCSLLSDNFGCERVILGVCRGLHIHTLALSHQIEFDRRLAKLARIEMAMEECVNQARTLSLPSDEKQAQDIVNAHQTLLEESGYHSLCSIPLLEGTEVIGVVTLIRTNSPEFDEQTLQSLKHVVAGVAPILALKLKQSRSLNQKVNQSMRALVGYRDWRSKAMIIALLVAIVVAALVDIDHRVSASASINGTVQRVLVAPYSGYLKSAHVRAGDEVKKNQVLAVLDSSDLQLERERWRSERGKHAKEYLQALAQSDRASVSITRARMAQVDAQLQRVQSQLERAQLRAPFDGVLASGDLSQVLGVPVERGQQLFELVPLRSLSAVLMVDEHDVAGLKVGQQGELRLTSLPGQALGFQVSKILPLANATNSGNGFPVEVQLDSVPSGLRLGMQGVGKIVIGEDSALWVWSRPLVNRLRLWLWYWGI